MATCWVFTWNNYGQNVPIYKERTMWYITWAPQRASTPHLQGYVQFKKPKARCEVSKMLGNKCYVAKAKGTYVQNRSYIWDDEKKTNTGPPVEHGTPQVELMNTPSQQGLRTDLIECREELKKRKARDVEAEMPDLWAKYPQYMIGLTMNTRDKADIKWPLTICGHVMHKPDPSVKKRHIWIVGSPDAGKTRMIGELTKGQKVYWAPANAKNRFEMYDDEELIIYDDVIPSLKEILHVSNHKYGKQQRIGGKRYAAGYWQEDSDVNIIILSNQSTDGFPPSFHARFNTITISAGRLGDGARCARVQGPTADILDRLELRSGACGAQPGLDDVEWDDMWCPFGQSGL